MARRTILGKEVWIRQIFRSKAAQNGGVVRRSVDSVKQYATITALKAAVKAKGFHMLRSGDQYLIFCHTGHFKVIC